MNPFSKNNRETTTTIVAVAALFLSLGSLLIGELRYRRAQSPEFIIDVEQEHNGPISILESGGNAYFEGFVKVTIHNVGERPITISSIDASMKNEAVVTDNSPVLPAVHGDGEPVLPIDVSFVAIVEPFFDDRVASAHPIRYINEISLPITIEAHGAADVYVKVRSLIMESSHVVGELKKLIAEDSSITAGQFLGEAIKKGFGRLLKIKIGDKTVTASSGPDRTTTEIRIKSVDGILRKDRVSVP
jgi:hypothetical protein